MIFNDDLIFIHIGKTGGSSCASYLLHNIRPPIYNCHIKSIDEMKQLNIDGVIPKTDIGRHSTLAEALEYINLNTGKNLDDFRKVLAVIRHPYTLEYSLYKHLQKASVRKRRKANTKILKLANGNFKDFVKYAGHHRGNFTQDAFVRVNNEIPDCVELVRFETLKESFLKAVSPFIRDNPVPMRITLRYFVSSLIRRHTIDSFPHLNSTRYQHSIYEILTDDIEELIYQKHKFMFDSGLYSREIPVANI